MFILENSGIYKIQSKIDDRYYPGSSKHLLQQKDYNGRKYEHFRQLKLNRHHCKYLQRFYNKYGADALEFVIIKSHIPENQLIIEEQKLLDIAKTEPEKCFTNNFIAGKVEHTPEIRRKISEAGSGRKHSCYNHQIYKFKHRITQETFEGTEYNFRIKYNLFQSSINSLVKGRIKSVNNWIITNNSEDFFKHGLINKSIYKFRHRLTNEVFEGNQYTFCQRYNLDRGNIWNLTKNQRKSHKNWVLI